MSEKFESTRFAKKVWLTNHAVVAMKKRNVTLIEVKDLIENGEYLGKESPHGWIFYQFASRSDNNVCAAIVIGQAIIIKTIMVNWTERNIP